jgi:SAM-dependent methyltransferase
MDTSTPQTRLEQSERANWEDFYADRSRKCPFFVGVPDENLAEWLGSGALRGARALDIGCGFGRNAIYLAQHGFTVDAVDQSASAVDWAKEEVARAGVPVSVHGASIFEFDMQPGSYDLAYDGGCFHHMPPHLRGPYVDLVARALRPGGLFGLTCFTPEGGNELSDEEVYEQGSLGWGLGYDEARLREIWGTAFDVRELRRMREQPGGAGLFGKDFLWAVLMQRR